jgi:hypothetical protein
MGKADQYSFLRFMPALELTADNHIAFRADAVGLKN